MENNVLRFTVHGRPRAVQSVRFARVGQFVRKFQPREVLDWKNAVRFAVREQLPPDFAPIDGVPVRLSLKYYFAPPKSWPKRDLKRLAIGARFYKTTRPDVSDNLNKGIVDALTGLVWRDDALIAVMSAVKLYSPSAERTEILVQPLPQGAFPEGVASAPTVNDSTPTLF